MVGDGMSNPIAELARFDDLCRQLGSEIDLTDADTVDALMEGESDLKEIAQALLHDDDELEILDVGLDAKIKALKERQDNFKAQRERIRTMLGRIMERHPDKTLRLDTATITIKVTAKKLVITDEGKIPFDLMTSGTPKPDKKAIMDEMKDGREVPGCTLSNGPPSLQIRRK